MEIKNAKVRQILLNMGPAPHDPAKKLLQQSVGLDALQEARNSLFQCAITKYREKQHGDEQSATQGTCDQLILKSRRSIEAVIDDIFELYSYLNDVRPKFPKACLSSLKLKSSNNECPLVQDHQGIDETTNGRSTTKTMATLLSPSTISNAANSQMEDLKDSIQDLRNEISSLKTLFVGSIDYRSQVQVLENDRNNLQATIDLLMHGEAKQQCCCHTATQPTDVSNKSSKSPQLSHSLSVTEDKRQSQTSSPSTFSLKSTPPESFVPLANRFSVLTDHEQSDQQEPSAEEVIDHYFNELIKNRETPVKLSEQIKQYRTDQKSKYESHADVLLIGDSMIKKIRGPRFSKTKKVICYSYPGAKVEDIVSKKQNLVLEHTPNEIILHVGTNNTKDDTNSLIDKIQCVGRQMQTTSQAKITISIIHRREENCERRAEVSFINTGLRNVAEHSGWGFIDNDNIITAHLASDGVHLKQNGIVSFAKNIIKHLHIRSSISRNAEKTSSVNQQSYASVLVSPTPSAQLRNYEDFRMCPPNNKRKKTRGKQTIPPLPNQKIATRSRDWKLYLELVSKVMKSQ